MNRSYPEPATRVGYCAGCKTDLLLLHKIDGIFRYRCAACFREEVGRHPNTMTEEERVSSRAAFRGGQPGANSSTNQQDESHMNARTRIITLTDAQPVKILDEQWPTIAQAVGDSYLGSNPMEHAEAIEKSRLDHYSLRVRQHADGRAIVYGVLDAAIQTEHGEDYRGGERIDAGADIPAAVRRVGEYCKLPDWIIRQCIASLPPVELI